MADELKYDEVEPILIHAKETPSKPEHAAAIVFLHGLGSKASEWTDLATHLQSSLPHTTLLLPTAPFYSAVPPSGKTAWLLPLYAGAEPPLSRPASLDEDVSSHLATVTYLDTLLTSLVDRGIPPSRIVLVGFSQGGIISLLHLLVSEKFAGRLGGVAGICGYLPLRGEVERLRTERGLGEVAGGTRVFVAQGKEDVWVPLWMWEDTLSGLRELGVSRVEAREYDGGHEVGKKLKGDLVEWLKGALPKLD